MVKLKMNNSNTESVSIKMSATTLSPHLLDNLASEYHGLIAAVAGEGQHSDEVVVEFCDIKDPTLDHEYKAINLKKQFIRALEAFKVK
jgi:hypothetical protein